MSNVTMQVKVQQPAYQIGLLRIQSNYLIQELYKVKPDHEVFVKNPSIAEQVKEAVNASIKKSDDKSTEQPSQTDPA